MRLDDMLPSWAHQIIGAAFGIIFCAWFVDAPSEEVALIGVPSTLILIIYLVFDFVLWLRRRVLKLKE